MAVTSPAIPLENPAVQTAVPARQTVIAVRGLTVHYNGEPAVEDLTFDVQAGDRLAIIGPNGAGKSTLMKAIMGLLQPQAGSIVITEKGVGRLGYVPQHDEVDWTFPVTVRDVVMMGRTRHYSWLRQRRREQRQAVDGALARVGLSDLADRQVGELSGGQRRRTFIARALAQEADVLLLDEPFSGVDASAQASLMDVLDDLNRDGITILLSTHDLGLAFRRFTTVMALTRRLIAYGTPLEVYTPEILSQLYGGRLATLESGGHVSFFVDDHACDGC